MKRVVTFTIKYDVGCICSHEMLTVGNRISVMDGRQQKECAQGNNVDSTIFTKTPTHNTTKHVKNKTSEPTT